MGDRDRDVGPVKSAFRIGPPAARAGRRSQRVLSGRDRGKYEPASRIGRGHGLAGIEQIALRRDQSQPAQGKHVGRAAEEARDPHGSNRTQLQVDALPVLAGSQSHRRRSERRRRSWMERRWVHPEALAVGRRGRWTVRRETEDHVTELQRGRVARHGHRARCGIGRRHDPAVAGLVGKGQRNRDLPARGGDHVVAGRQARQSIDRRDRRSRRAQRPRTAARR